MTTGVQFESINITENGVSRHETQRRIDFILVFKTSEEKSNESSSKSREAFESNLSEEGLLLSYTNSIGNGEYTYVHIQAPWDLLTKYAELMKLRMPMKTIENNMKELFDMEYSTGRTDMRFTAPYTRDKEYLFDIPEDRDEFFTSSQRAQIVEFILKRKSFSSNPSDVFSIGINRLLSDEVYLAAYPLHEGKLDQDIHSTRSQLLRNWASLSSLLKHQPLGKIVDYFGVKIALYFAWVGFYTKMLIPASIVGVICFIYGIVSSFYDTPTNQVCDEMNGIFMCPLCDNCEFTRLSDTCLVTRVTYILDNPSTVVFAVFMSIWATIYLELWKRYSAKIAFKWDLSNFDAHEEYPRPETLSRLANKNTKRKFNSITRMEEPYLPFLRGKLPHIILSSSLILLCICLVIGIMVSVIAYRVSVKIAFRHPRNGSFLRSYGSYITTLTAATINLVFILVFDCLYTRIAYYLTEKELPRTQFEFDNSLTLKMSLFQFVNNYSSIFYIAFFKGNFGRTETKQGHYLTEICPIGGCFQDLAIQLIIIMIGKQAFGALVEVTTPIVTRLYSKWKYTKYDKSGDPIPLPQWEDDYLLKSWEPTSLLYEYLELVSQFGFVTIFVCAFPLAPLFALINNFFEIRFDAQKMITDLKRPVAQRVKDIGIWYRILDTIAKVSVITNALIIAFTSSFIPRLLYYIDHSNLDNYLTSSISVLNITEDFQQKLNITFCVIEDSGMSFKAQYFGGPDGQYWRLMAARLMFVLIYENVIVLLTSLMRVLIPDVPKDIVQQQRLHLHLTNELIMRHDMSSGSSNTLSSKL